MTKYYAPALDKGLDILEFLSAQVAPQSQLEIATGIDRKPNEIYRMLVSLENRGYINKDSISGKYSLTLRLFHLAHNHSTIDTMVKASEIHLSNLANAINQSVHLGVLYQNKLMIIAQVQSRTPVSLSVEIGSLFPLDKTNSGKLILAHSSPQKQNHLLSTCDSYISLSKKEQKAFCEELETCKELKVLSNKSMLTDGVTDFSAPILNMRQEVVAVLAVSTLTSQMRQLVSKEEIEKELLLTVEKITASLGIGS